MTRRRERIIRRYNCFLSNLATSLQVKDALARRGRSRRCILFLAAAQFDAGLARPGRMAVRQLSSATSWRPCANRMSRGGRKIGGRRRRKGQQFQLAARMPRAASIDGAADFESIVLKNSKARQPHLARKMWSADAPYQKTAKRSSCDRIRRRYDSSPELDGPPSVGGRPSFSFPGSNALSTATEIRRAKMEKIERGFPRRLQY